MARRGHRPPLRAASSVIALMLEPEQIGLRITTAAAGVILVAVAGVVASYVITYASTAQNVADAYQERLLGVGRSIARTWATLQRSTSQRRSLDIAQEETYQAMVIAATESLLEQYETIALLCGPAGDAFSVGKRDLDLINETLYSDSAELRSATQSNTSGSINTAKPVSVRVECPYCNSRVLGKIALRAGWTSATRCNRCGQRLNIHRGSDLQAFASRMGVHTSPPSDTAIAFDTTHPPGDESQTARQSDSNLPDAAARLESELANQASINCPTCNVQLNLLSAPQPGSDGLCWRYCVNCHSGIYFKADDLDMVRTEFSEPRSAQILERDRAYAVLRCPHDGVGVKATYRGADNTWIAICPVHRQAYSVTRAEMRAWYAENSPEYFRTRIKHEKVGGTRVLTDEPA